MDIDEKIRIGTQREQIVTQANTLVQKSRFELSLPEQKTIAYITSLIKPRSAVDRVKKVPYQLEYEFDIKDYCKVCGIDYNSGTNYSAVKETLKKLSDRSIWFTLDDGTETLLRWISKVWTNKRSGKVKVRLDEDIVPFLFDLQANFTEYELYNILGMKSSFSVRLYEILKSYAFQKSKTFNLGDLKRLLMVDTVKSYTDFSLFRKKVLEIALKEINLLSNINVTYETIKKGNRVDKIKFRMENKNPIEKMFTANIVYDKLDSQYN